MDDQNTARVSFGSASCSAARAPLLAPAACSDGQRRAGQSKSATCAACHGADGNSVSPIGRASRVSTPLHRSPIEGFKSGDRTDVTMQPFANDVRPGHARRRGVLRDAEADAEGRGPALLCLGQQIYRGGVPERGIAACIACHGPAGTGTRSQHIRVSAVSTRLRREAAGRLRFRRPALRRRLNQMMRNVAALLIEDEINALASYVQGLNSMPRRRLWLDRGLRRARRGGGPRSRRPRPIPRPSCRPPDRAALQPEPGRHPKRSWRRPRRASSSARTTPLVADQPTSSCPDKVEVAEIFWYGCPHCFALDPFLVELAGTSPST